MSSKQWFGRQASVLQAVELDPLDASLARGSRPGRIRKFFGRRRRPLLTPGSAKCPLILNHTLSQRLLTIAYTENLSAALLADLVMVAR